MKQYRLNYSLLRSEDRKELWNKQFVYLPSDKDLTLALKISLGVLVTDVIEIIEKDVKGDFTFGHLRVAKMVGVSLDSVDKALTAFPPSCERKIITKSECDFSTNYMLVVTIEDIIPEKRRNRVELISRLLRGE